ncbi:branched-chain amino acid transport system substrate-binding protein [Mesorhizobium soli]|uniref:ABC transporter substrate-binding protein n=1 Tax=Pseudaminobacter soli (ex Li et al. 2025) TaxID=1295366 RepID=UPI0024758E12|nr:ABC transporter substrate-binding protein [Mesorhizobium soli]MDH6235025.1 branched-chain amino acid transport system substrate-binding protein [Mesorhizobium soli]
MKHHLLRTGLAGLMLAAGLSSAWAEDPIIIGAAIAQSGAIAPYDEGPAKAMEIAVDEINAKGGVLGRPLKIIYSDTKSDIAYGATAAQDVIDKGAQMVVVTCDYDYGSAAASVADAAGLITFSTCAGDPKFGPSGIGPNAFTMATGAPGQAVALAEWAYNVKGWRSAYVLLDTSIAFDASFSDFFERRWKELAGADGLIGKDTFGGEDPQIASQITRVKGLPKEPDFVVLCSFPPGGPSAMRQLRAAGVNQPLLLSESWDGDFWLEAIPNLTDAYLVTYGSVFGNDPRPEVADFMKKFTAKFGAPPVTSHALTGYSVIQGWTKAVEKAGTIDADKVREVLETFADEPLLAGPTTFTKDTHINMQRDLILLEVKDGKAGNVVDVIKAHQMPK